MEKIFLKKGISEKTEVVDSETGEILGSEIKVHTYIANTKEEFFMGYSALIGAFMEMSQAEIRIFGYCLRYVKGVKFDISKKLRISMGSEISLNERTILNTLPLLLEKKLLIQHEDGLYQLNPKYAFQGGSTERIQALKVILELGIEI